MRPPRQPRKPPPPLDPAMLDAIAVRYLERFQTSRARLVRLLQTKIRMRGWVDGAPPPDPDAVADRMVALGYVDDAAFADSRARSLTRRGLGRGRVAQALHASGIDSDTSSAAMEGQDGVATAIAFARRKRFGPFGPPVTDPKLRQRQLATMARAGHPPSLALAILRAGTEEELPCPEDEGA